MPEPRYPVPITAAPRISLEPASRASTRDRRRRGALPVEVRNGLPVFRPYVYRGTGVDQLTGGDDDA